jgi:hypothetical protein
MIFEHQHCQSIVQLQLNRFRELDSQDVFRDRRLVLTLDFTEWDALGAGLGLGLRETGDAA